MNKLIYNLLGLIAAAHSEQNTIVVFTDSEFSGQAVRLNTTQCVPSLPSGFDNSISSINTEGHCVNLYKDEDCFGNYVVMKPGTPLHNNLAYWEGLDNQVSSIGPCDPECNPRNIQTRPDNSSTIITVYDHANYKGYHVSMDLKGCVDIPRKLKKKVSSMKSEDKSICIEFHEHWNCTGSAIQLRPGSPLHAHLGYWDLNDNAGAVSLCGYRCNRTTPLNLNISFPGPNIVTLYDEPNFKGNFQHFNLTKGCINVSDEWEGESFSIQPYKQCIIIYEKFGCSRRGKNLQLDLFNINTQVNLVSDKFDQLIRSIEPCEPVVVGNGGQALGQSSGGGNGALQILGFTTLGLVVVGLGVALVCFNFRGRRPRTVNQIL